MGQSSSCCKPNKSPDITAKLKSIMKIICVSTCCIKDSAIQTCIYCKHKQVMEELILHKPSLKQTTLNRRLTC